MASVAPKTAVLRRRPTAPLTRCGALGAPVTDLKKLSPHSGACQVVRHGEACRRHRWCIPPSWGLGTWHGWEKIASARGTHTPIAYHDDIRGWRGTPRTLAMLLPVVWHWQLQTERAKSSVALQVLWARRSKRPRSGIFRVPTTASSLLPELDVFAINGYIQPRANGRQPAPSGRRTPSSGQTGLSDVGFPG